MSFMDHIPLGSPRPLRSQARPNYRNPDAFRTGHNLTPPSEWQGDGMDAAPEAELAADMQSKIKRPKQKWHKIEDARKRSAASGKKSMAERVQAADARRDQMVATPGEFTAEQIARRFGVAVSTAGDDGRRLINAGRMARRKEGPPTARYFVYWSLEVEEEEEG